MPRFALLALALLLLLTPPALAGQTKEFKGQNLKWTIPDGWPWIEVSDADKKMGYVARTGARSGDALVIFNARVAPTNDLSLQEISEEVRTQLPQGVLKSTSGTSIKKGKLSGLDGTVVYAKGINREDVRTLIRVWTVSHGGKFYQLFVFCMNGAEAKLASAVDEVRRGYRLIEGAGPQEEPGDTEAYEEEDLEGGSGGTGSAADWPEKGPKKEGDTVTFPTHNLKWTKPAGSAFDWDNVYSDEAEALPEQGLRVMISLRAAKEREASKETDPQRNTAQVVLLVGNEPPGFDPNRLATSDQEKSFLMESFFDAPNMAMTDSFEDVDIGNHTGGALKMGGRKENVAVFLWNWYVGLRGRIYIWRVVVAGGSEANGVFKNDIQALMATVEFLEIEEPIQGPIAVALVPPSGEYRGKGEGTEKKITSVGFTAKKPKGIGNVRYLPEERPQGWQNPRPNFRLAWESRDEGGQHFFFFTVSSYPVQAGQKNVEQQLLDNRVNAWTQAAEGAVTISKGKEAGFKDKWGKAKGLGYEFTGTYRNKPVMERGWVVIYKKYAYVFRAQYGGEGAEKKYSKLFKKVKKGIKF